ncbi:acyl-CoA dehydrogenase family protein [Derxia gummosa]|uniref:Acyl-CoA dehydrogenase family protein n=1 Tax=Derxia gummosa DSM 723 TaxID=1121388 RepID=A0A9U5GS89_9BURK|nr:acyl-CoA dehydrogenase family protein [Derxia gummosa]
MLIESLPPDAPAVSPANADWDALLADIRARRDEFARERRIAPDVIARFKQLGVYRALVARRFGGDEKSPREFCEMIERIAGADGSAGWVASFGIGAIYLAGLPVQTLAKIYADGPDVVFAGGIFPPQAAPVVEGGYEVTGRWSFGSGCYGAEMIGVGILPQDGSASPLPRMAVLPRAKVSIEHAWDVIGLEGTGSHDLVVTKQVVSPDWTFVRGGASSLDTPLYRYPTLSFATQVLSVVSLGIARAALDELRAMATGRVSVTGAPRLADRPHAQMEVARSEAALRAARAFFYGAIDEVWAVLRRGDTPSREQISLLRLSATHATRTGAEVTRAVQMLTGMTGIYNASPLARQVRDSLVITQHAFMGDITYQNAGAIFFDQAPLPGYL